ncbi:hypothetical protein D3C86_2013400 [compost metagenome]
MPSDHGNAHLDVANHLHLHLMFPKIPAAKVIDTSGQIHAGTESQPRESRDIGLPIQGVTLTDFARKVDPLLHVTGGLN